MRMLGAMAGAELANVIIDKLPDMRLGSRRWFSHAAGFEVYVRLGQRLAANGLMPSLELPNIEVAAALRGQGIFTALLDTLIPLAQARGLVLFVENVMNPIARDALVRRGFTLYQQERISYILQPRQHYD